MNHTTLSQFLTGPQAATDLGIKPNPLRRWRCSGRGPRYVRLGSSTRGRVVYRMKDLEHWLESNSYQHTAEETVANSSQS